MRIMSCLKVALGHGSKWTSILVHPSCFGVLGYQGFVMICPIIRVDDSPEIHSTRGGRIKDTQAGLAQSAGMEREGHTPEITRNYDCNAAHSGWVGRSLLQVVFQECLTNTTRGTKCTLW